eukprot:gene23900-9467_t
MSTAELSNLAIAAASLYQALADSQGIVSWDKLLKLCGELHLEGRGQESLKDKLGVPRIQELVNSGPVDPPARAISEFTVALKALLAAARISTTTFMRYYEVEYGFMGNYCTPSSQSHVVKSSGTCSRNFSCSSSVLASDLLMSSGVKRCYDDSDISASEALFASFGLERPIATAIASAAPIFAAKCDVDDALMGYF